MSRRESGHERKERNLYKSGQPRLTITNPPIKRRGSDEDRCFKRRHYPIVTHGDRPQFLDGFERACASRRNVEICARLLD
jgi:hypothetical protein